MTTDFRALCAELYGIFEKYDDESNLAGIYWDMEKESNDILDRARAALAEPEPDGPTPAGPSDDELDKLFFDIDQGGEPESWRAFARAVLAHWGNRSESPDSSTPQPVPISERLPGPEDCDAEEECYWFDPEGSGAWYQDTYQGNYTHWLPVHALPLPKEGEA